GRTCAGGIKVVVAVEEITAADGIAAQGQVELGQEIKDVGWNRQNALHVAKLDVGTGCWSNRESPLICNRSVDGPGIAGRDGKRTEAVVGRQRLAGRKATIQLGQPGRGGNQGAAGEDAIGAHQFVVEAAKKEQLVL